LGGVSVANSGEKLAHFSISDQKRGKDVPTKIEKIDKLERGQGKSVERNGGKGCQGQYQQRKNFQEITGK